MDNSTSCCSCEVPKQLKVSLYLKKTLFSDLLIIIILLCA